MKILGLVCLVVLTLYSFCCAETDDSFCTNCPHCPGYCLYLKCKENPDLDYCKCLEDEHGNIPLIPVGFLGIHVTCQEDDSPADKASVIVMRHILDMSKRGWTNDRGNIWFILGTGIYDVFVGDNEDHIIMPGLLLPIFRQYKIQCLPDTTTTTVLPATTTVHPTTTIPVTTSIKLTTTTSVAIPTTTTTKGNIIPPPFTSSTTSSVEELTSTTSTTIEEPESTTTIPEISTTTTEHQCTTTIRDCESICRELCECKDEAVISILHRSCFDRCMDECQE